MSKPTPRERDAAPPPEAGRAARRPGRAGPAPVAGRFTRTILSAPAPTVFDLVRRRWRVLWRLLRLDTPALWRLTAHAAVLVLTAAAFLGTRIHTSQAAVAAEPETLPAWAQRVGDQARRLLPEPVIETEDGAPERVAPAAVGAPASGFVAAGLIAEADPSLLPWDEPQRYTARAGDTIGGIAADFGRSVETLLYANPELRENPHQIAIGTEITILPVDGVLHVVEEGETLEAIAETYEASTADIVAYTPNGLDRNSELTPGMEVVVPGGRMDIVIPSYFSRFASSRPGVGAGAWNTGGSGPVVGTGSFYTASFGRVTRGWAWWHQAVDIANSTGTPIYAVDAGSVRHAGWWSWAGNAVIIDHGNGFESLYAHMSSIHVAAGQRVERGQIIGAIGCTFGAGGWCSGPHLHLELSYNGARVNPCGYGVCP